MKRDLVYLKHILDAIARIESYVSVGRDVFLSTPHWQDATIRQLEIIGEATKRVSQDLRSGYADISWQRIAGLRDVLIHDYPGIDLAEIRDITENDVPVFKKQVEGIARALEQTP